ncbi:MAG: diacylglycerol kinase family protein [Bacteroidia bacterium]|nr:diacylglycerol kinase family protein [Bacteroidia bacterium]
MNQFVRFLKSFEYAWHGIVYTVTTQPNFRRHIVVALFAILAGWYYHLSFTEWSLVLLSIGFVWTTELVNTAFEHLTDIVTPEYNELIGKVKDIAAGAVLFAAIAAGIVGLIVFLPHIL